MFKPKLQNIANYSFRILPYYLEANLEVDFPQLDNELKQINFNDSNAKDDTYFKYIENMKEIKNSITYEFNDDIIKLCDKGLNLSIELCEYCISKSYDTTNFVIYETKEYYNYFKEQLESKTLKSLYQQASSLEKEGCLKNALELYINILEEYSPTGPNYYSYPFNLAINIFDYNSASKILLYLNNAINSKKLVNLTNLFNTLSSTLLKINSNENLYPYIKKTIFDILNCNPGILQTDVYKELGLDNKESFRFILYYWEKLKIIKRDKYGRTYKLYLTQRD